MNKKLLISILSIFIALTLMACQTNEPKPSLSEFLKKFPQETKGLDISFKLPKAVATPLSVMEKNTFIIGDEKEAIPFAIHKLSENFHTISYYMKTAEGLEFYLQTISLEGQPLGGSMIVKYTKEGITKSTYKCCHSITTKYFLQGKTEDFLLKEQKIDKNGNWELIRDYSKLVFDYEPVPSGWKAVYRYSNKGGKAGKYLLGNEYELSLEKTPILRIYSESMASPHAAMFVEVKESGQKIEIFLKELIYSTKVEDKTFSNLQKGALLFGLENKEGMISTTWSEMKPFYGEIKKDGILFNQIH